MSSRQPTPGPSLINHTQKRRAVSETGPVSETEALDDTRDAKKIKVDLTPKKKKRRRKQKKTSVVVMSPSRTRSLSRSVAPVPSCTVSTQSVNAQATFALSDSMEQNGPTADDPAPTSSNKGKERAKSPTPTPQLVNVEEDRPLAVLPSITSNSDALEIARLEEQLATQRHLLERHQTHLTQVQQSLTCQICLDLLHKPYALAPCGHITCYGCLVRWFTSTPDHPNQNQNLDPVAAAAAPPDAGQENPEQEVTHLLSGLRRNQHVYKRKTCPLCRAVVSARPVEVYGVKGMVGALVRSALVDLPAPIPVAGPSTDNNADNANANPTNADPWKNIFPAERRTHGHGLMGQDDFYGFLGGRIPPAAPQEERDREQVGWFDEEDGGIYRCLDCMHEIWGGICSRCGREYPAHVGDDDDEDDEDGDENGGTPRRRFRSRAIRQLLLRAVNAAVRDEDEEDDDDGLDEEMVMADDEEYLDRLEEIAGYRNALFGAGGRGQFRVASLPPIGEDDMMLGRLELTDSEGDEEGGNENENGWLVDDGNGNEGWAVGIPPAAQIRGLGPGSPRIYADFTDEEDTPRLRARNDTDDEGEGVTDEDDDDDDGFIDDSEVIDLVDDEGGDGDEEIMATLARLRETRDEGRGSGRDWGRLGGFAAGARGSRAAGGASRAGAEGSRASARARESTQTNARSQPILILSDEEGKEEDGTRVRLPTTRRRLAARRLEASEDEEDEEGEIAVEDAVAALDELDFDNDEEEDREREREVRMRRRRIVPAAERRRG